MSPDLIRLEVSLAGLDRKLRGIAKRPVDINDPSWVDKLRAHHPLDEAGIRAPAQELLSTAIDLYARSDAHERRSLRGLFARYSSFTWATGVSEEPTDEASFRRHLLSFSLRDQAPDARDQVLNLHQLCATAENAGVRVDRILEEVAELSDNVDKYGMGSTEEILLKSRRTQAS